MPGTLEAALVFGVLIVPGLLLVSGYNRTRAHALPSRDLYAVAQAITVSLAWLPAVWLLGGRSIVDWSEADTLRDNDGEIVAIVLINLAAPLVGGLVVGRVVNWLGDQTGLKSVIGWTGIFDPPTAWDAAWLLAQSGSWAAVEIRLKDGQRFHVLSDKTSRIGLSPAPRYLFFNTEYDWKGDEQLRVEEHQGIFINATEVVSVRVEHVEPKDE